MIEKSDQLPDKSERTPELNELRGALNHYLSSLKIPFIAPTASSPSDHPLYNDCIQYMSSRNWSPSTIKTLQKCLPAGLAMDIAYAHLPSTSSRVFIIVYTALVIYVDDVCPSQNLDALKSFSITILKGGSHDHDALNALSDHLREIPQHFNKVTGELIFSSTLRYVSSIILEDVTSRSSNLSSKKFPLFLRGLTGSPEAYASFAFPPSVPWEAYIQIIPDMMTYDNFCNDILSFYKEELAGEEANLISLLAISRNTTKIDIVRQLVEEAIEADKVIINVLQDNNEALEAYVHFRAGFVAFHTSLSRYRLDELL